MSASRPAVRCIFEVGPWCVEATLRWPEEDGDRPLIVEEWREKAIDPPSWHLTEAESAFYQQMRVDMLEDAGLEGLPYELITVSPEGKHTRTHVRADGSLARHGLQ